MRCFARRPSPRQLAVSGSAYPTMNLPTFIIGGAPRAGTTYLYSVLDRHPDVYMAKPRSPEPKFFLVDDEYRQGLEYYSRKYFLAAAGRRAIGEKSTNYLESPTAASRIHQTLPGVKLVFALRNPVDRAFSNYLWSKKNGLETLSFQKAIETESTRETDYSPSHRYSRPFSYVSRGLYADLLAPYLELFPREQLEIVFLEEIEANPRATMDRLCRSLGVGPLPEDVDLASRINSAREDDVQVSAAMREKLNAIFREPNRRLARLLGRDLSHWTG
jgi:hypothetical protein